MTGVLRLRRLLGAVALPFALVLPLTSMAQERGAAALASLSDVVTSAADRWAQQRKVYVDGSLIADAVATARAALVAACWGTPTQCEQAAERQGVAANVGAYLESLLSNPVGAILTGDLIFKRIGFDKARLGWPSGPAANRYVAVRFPDGYDRLTHVLWNGNLAIARSPTVLLLPMGIHGFVGTQKGGQSKLLRLTALRDADGKPQVSWTDEPGGDTRARAPWRVEPELARFCLNKSVDPTEPKYRLATGRGAQPVVSASDFHGASILRVRLIAEDRDCNDKCRAAVSAFVIQALAQWRAGCTRCPPATLSLVEVDDAQFVSVRHVETALQWPYLRPQKNADGVLASEVASMATSQGAGVDVRMGFQRVDGVASALGLCSSIVPAGVTAGFALLSEQVRERVCRPSALASCGPSNGCKEITMRLSGAPDCANALACGFPDQSVTLNTPRFRFAIAGPDATRPPIASLGQAGPSQRQDYIPLHPVLLHEVGHWFGLPHVDTDAGPDGRDEIMIDTGGSDQVCISRAALNMLDSAVDQAWQFRQTGKGLLRYVPR